MSLDVEQSLHNLLVSSTAITNLVSISNIRMGVQKTTPTSYPCILITQVGGSDIPYLGYSSSPSGSRFGVENVSYQIDIFNQTSPKKNLDIYDVMKIPLMTDGFVKSSDNSILEEELDAFRQITRWSKIQSHSD